MVVTDMSWAGHDFLAALENKDVWSKLKQTFSAEQLASLPLDVIKGVGTGLLLHWAKGQAGLS